MSIRSGLKSTWRRVPKQVRGEERVAALLAAAAEVIFEKGYNAATLKEVAMRAGASIGSLYRYFPDKPTIVEALASQYGGEIKRRWAAAAADAPGLPVEDVAERILQLFLHYLEERPAFSVLLTDLENHRHNIVVRTHLRDHSLMIFRSHQGLVANQELNILSDTIVQLLQALCSALKHAVQYEHSQIIQEYRCILQSYIGARLSKRRSP